MADMSAYANLVLCDYDNEGKVNAIVSVYGKVAFNSPFQLSIASPVSLYMLGVEQEPKEVIVTLTWGAENALGIEVVIGGRQAGRVIVNVWQLICTKNGVPNPDMTVPASHFVWLQLNEGVDVGDLEGALDIAINVRMLTLVTYEEPGVVAIAQEIKKDNNSVISSVYSLSSKGGITPDLIFPPGKDPDICGISDTDAVDGMTAPDGFENRYEEETGRLSAFVDPKTPLKTITYIRVGTDTFMVV